MREKLERALEEKNALFTKHFGSEAIDLQKTYEDCLKLGERLKPFIGNVRGLLMEALSQKKTILFEGAQGTLLDVDHGTYPYVTSSSVVAGGIPTGCGLPSNVFSQVIGITKAYTTRVGTGPFPTEIEKTEPEVAKLIRDVGAEYGATTGRPRRVGWLDLVALKYAVEINGITGIAFMKTDVLRGFKTIKVCTAYKLDGKTIKDWPPCVEDLENLEPIYETLTGWGQYDPAKTKTLGDLPKELRDYIVFVEKYLGVPISMVSTGPGREESIEVINPFRAN